MLTRCLIGLTFLSALLPAQSVVGSLTADVVTASGRPLPATVVTLTDLARNQQRTVLADSTGVVVFSGLRPAVYRLGAQLEGYLDRKSVV